MRFGRRWWAISSALVALVVIGWMVLRIDLDQLRVALEGADPKFLLLVPASIALEQMVRAYKWRILLYPSQVVPARRLFGAIMTGYLANLLVPFGANELVRSWVIARLEGLAMSAILATVVVDRLLDGIAFTGFVALVILFAAFPDSDGDLRAGLMTVGVGCLVFFAGSLVALAYYKRHLQLSGSWMLNPHYPDDLVI